MLYCGSFSQYNVRVYWLIHGHTTSNKLFPAKLPFLPASALDQNVTKGGMIMVQLMYNKSLDDFPSGNSEFCFPCISILGKQNTLFPSGPVIRCLLLTSSKSDANHDVHDLMRPFFLGPTRMQKLLL